MKIQMKFKVARSLLVLLLALILVIGGTTVAWFTAEYRMPSAAEMIMGTLSFEITDAAVVSAGDEPEGTAGEPVDWEAGECKEFSWTFKNTGSKKALFRAWPKAEFTGLGSLLQEESAWGEGQLFNGEQGNWAMFFTHGSYDEDEGKPTTTRLLAGQDIDIGTIAVWEEGNKLHIRYTTQNGWYMTETHLAVAASMEGLLGGKKKNPAPGQFSYQGDHNLVQSFTYVIDLPDYNHIYLAAHAKVEKRDGGAVDGQITWLLPKEGPNWVGGPDVFYYCQPVAKGEEVVLELRGCLDEDAGSGTCSVELEAGAVQATHGAANTEWPGNPCAR